MPRQAKRTESGLARKRGPAECGVHLSMDRSYYVMSLQADLPARLWATSSHSIGKIDTKTMPIVTSEKLFLTIGTLPNSQPAPRHSVTHDTAPTMLYSTKEAVVICAAPATNGTNVRTIGTKRPRMTAFPPYCSKKACARSRYCVF